MIHHKNIYCWNKEEFIENLKKTCGQFEAFQKLNKKYIFRIWMNCLHMELFIYFIFSVQNIMVIWRTFYMNFIFTFIPEMIQNVMCRIWFQINVSLYCWIYCLNIFLFEGDWHLEFLYYGMGIFEQLYCGNRDGKCVGIW